MRTSTSLTQNEIDAYTQFASENKIITDGDVGVKNADILCKPIIDRNSDITPQTLSVSLSRVKDQIKYKSAAHSRADELAYKLSSTEVEAYRNWAARQSRWIGLDGSEEGFENFASRMDAWQPGDRTHSRSCVRKRHQQSAVRSRPFQGSAEAGSKHCGRQN